MQCMGALRIQHTSNVRWHFAHVPPAMWSWWKCWRESLSRWTLRVVQQICMQEADQIERAASLARARAWKDWGSTTAMADGARLAHHWLKQVVPGRTRRSTQMGWQSRRKNRLIE